MILGGAERMLDCCMPGRIPGGGMFMGGLTSLGGKSINRQGLLVTIYYAIWDSDKYLLGSRQNIADLRFSGIY